jgi:hypothetical protein
MKRASFLYWRVELWLLAAAPTHCDKAARSGPPATHRRVHNEVRDEWAPLGFLVFGFLCGPGGGWTITIR